MERINSTVAGALMTDNRYSDRISSFRYGRRIKTNPPTVVVGISDSILAILPIFSRLVTAGVTMSFCLNKMLSLIVLRGIKISSSLMQILNGSILPPLRMRTPL